MDINEKITHNIIAQIGFISKERHGPKSEVYHWVQSRVRVNLTEKIFTKQVRDMVYVEVYSSTPLRTQMQ